MKRPWQLLAWHVLRPVLVLHDGVPEVEEHELQGSEQREVAFAEVLVLVPEEQELDDHVFLHVVSQNVKRFPSMHAVQFDALTIGRRSHSVL